MNEADTDSPAVHVPRAMSPVVVPLVVGVLVAIALGAYGRVHDPTGRSLVTGFFTDTARLKSWLATLAVTMALSQPVSALWISTLDRGRGRDPRRGVPTWIADLHKLIGTLAFAASLPVAYHCLWALGYQTDTSRVAVHSLAGCAFYGAYAAKVMVVRRPNRPVWAVPALGAVTLVVFVTVWWTGSLWFFHNVTWVP